MIDREPFGLEIDCAPPQTDRFTPTQTVKCGKNDAKLQNISLDLFKQMVKLLLRVKTRLKRSLFRPFNFIRGIVGDRADPKRILQRFPDICVAMDDGVRGKVVDLHLVGVVILDVLRRYLLQQKPGIMLVKIRNDFFLDRHLIGGKGRDFHASLHHGKPIGKKTGEGHRFIDAIRFRILREEFEPELFLFFPDRLLQHFVGTLFVSFNGEPRGFRRRVPFTVLVRVAEHDVIVPVSFSQMSCYHK